MNDEQLLELNKQGFIPGPSETKEDFILRINYCLNLKEHLKTKKFLEKSFAESMDDSFLNLNSKPKKHFDIEPSWIPVFFSNYQLMPWHGGSAWIFQENETLPTAAFFQLRRQFKNQTHYLKIYNRVELIAHEISHVGRMMFDEPKFEELIAYRTSDSSFRRFFGSIVQSSRESQGFMLTLFLILCFNYFILLFTDALEWVFILNTIPLAMIAFAVIRLLKRQREFSKALENVKGVLKNQEMAEAFLYRLQDKEIQLFSKMTKDEIYDYAKKQQPKSLRWHLLVLAYI